MATATDVAAQEEVQATVEPSQELAPVVDRKQAIAIGSRGLQLSTLADMYRFAQYVHASRLAPKGFQTAESVLIALQMGAELGLPPMASLQNIAVINGRPSIWGDAMLGVCMASGVFDQAAFKEEIEQKAGMIVARCTVRRLPNGEPSTREFSMADAKQAKLDTKEGPWQQYPKRMLQLRARSWALRDRFADILRGFAMAEEAMDMDAISVEHSSPKSRAARSSLNELVDAPPAEGAAPPPPAIDWKKLVDEVLQSFGRAKSPQQLEDVALRFADDEQPGMPKHFQDLIRVEYESRMKALQEAERKPAAKPKAGKPTTQGELLPTEGTDSDYYRSGQ